MKSSMKKYRTYSELMKLETFEERFNYLKLDGKVGKETFGYDRILNQMLYKDPEWRKEVRPKIIKRDQGYDLGCRDREIGGSVLVHHINPITVDDILRRDPKVFDPENLISTCLTTHNAIHYSDESILMKDPIVRKANDTCPWKK